MQLVATLLCLLQLVLYRRYERAKNLRCSLDECIPQSTCETTGAAAASVQAAAQPPQKLKADEEGALDCGPMAV